MLGIGHRGGPVLGIGAHQQVLRVTEAETDTAAEDLQVAQEKEER